MCRISFISSSPLKRPSSPRQQMQAQSIQMLLSIFIVIIKIPFGTLHLKKKEKEKTISPRPLAQCEIAKCKMNRPFEVFLFSIRRNCDTRHEAPYASTAAAHSQRVCRTALMNGLENGTICTRDRRHRHIGDEKSTLEPKKRIFFVMFGNAHSGPRSAHTQHITSHTRVSHSE